MCNRFLIQALSMAVGLLFATLSAAQQPAPSQPAADAKKAPPATTAKSAKPAKKKAAPEFKMVLEPKAMDLLKATSERLAKAKSMSFTATASYEYPSRLGPPSSTRCAMT